MNCPLCKTVTMKPFWSNMRYDYHRCPSCYLVFVPPHQLPQASAEKAQYDLHNNNPSDKRYISFLNRLARPVLDYLQTEGLLDFSVDGLDFGSGPGPAMHRLFGPHGIEIKTYDIFYNPDESVWSQKYTFITASEVFEHLHQPDKVIEKLICHLKPRGVLAIMTKQVLDNEAFKTWHYKNDPTHVIFFSQVTFQYLAARYNLQLRLISTEVVLLIKP